MAKLIMAEGQIEFSGTQMDMIMFYIIMTNTMIEEFGEEVTRQIFKDAQELKIDSVSVKSYD